MSDLPVTQFVLRIDPTTWQITAVCERCNGQFTFKPDTDIPMSLRVHAGLPYPSREDHRCHALPKVEP